MKKKPFKSLPARPTIKTKYLKGDKKSCSFRLPAALLERLAEEAESKGYSATEVLEFVLDQYLQEQD